MPENRRYVGLSSTGSKHELLIEHVDASAPTEGHRFVVLGHNGKRHAAVKLSLPQSQDGAQFILGADAALLASGVAEQLVRDVLNEAADDVITAAELPDTGAKDAINLVVNAALHRLFSDRSAELDAVVAANYDASYSEVLGWIDGN